MRPWKKTVSPLPQNSDLRTFSLLHQTNPKLLNGLCRSQGASMPHKSITWWKKLACRRSNIKYPKAETLSLEFPDTRRVGTHHCTAVHACTHIHLVSDQSQIKLASCFQEGLTGFTGRSQSSYSSLLPAHLCCPSQCSF